MEAHTKVWNSGKVCRNAAAQVARMAERRGTLRHLPMFATDNPKEGHVMTVLRHDGKFYLIESVMEGDTYFPTFLELSGYDPKRDIKLYAEMSGRVLTKYLGDATHNDVECWLNEEDCKANRMGQIEQALNEIEGLKHLLGVGEKILKTFTKEFPELWTSYEKRVQELESQYSVPYNR
jgi:hypothetical protein